MVAVEGQSPGRIGRQAHALARQQAVIAGANLGAEQVGHAVHAQVDDGAVAEVLGEFNAGGDAAVGANQAQVFGAQAGALLDRSPLIS